MVAIGQQEGGDLSAADVLRQSSGGRSEEANACWGASHSEMSTCYFAGFWAGVTGTYPGSGTGTQPLESFHSYWHLRVRSAARTTPTEIFSSMQKLFEEDWCKKFQWAERRSFLTWPDKPAMDLLNSQSLRTAGRSPAVDFWSHREKRLTGLRNYCKLWRRTDKTSAATQSKDGYTTLWAMRARKFKKEMPAEASISLKTAESVADLVCCGGKGLAAVLRKCGIVESHQKLSVDLLEHYLAGHCAVLQGHLADAMWPRVRRRLQQPLPTVLCTCGEFMQHADCEHVVCVKALENNQGAESLNNIPVLRPNKGRKRKAEAALPAPVATRKQRRGVTGQTRVAFFTNLNLCNVGRQT